MDENRVIRDAVFEVLGILGTISPTKMDSYPNIREEGIKIRRAESILRRSVDNHPEVTMANKIPTAGKMDNMETPDGVVRFGNICIGYKKVSVKDVLESLENQIQDMTYGGLTEDAEMLALAGILIKKAYMDKEEDGGSYNSQKKEVGAAAGCNRKPEKGKPDCDRRCR